jgi:hypothetical protein
MLGRRSIRDSVGYVSLGLFAHAVLDELSEVRSKPETPPTRKKAIELAIRSLGAMQSATSLKPFESKNLVFRSYQEVTTLRRMFSAGQRIKSPDELQSILSAIIGDDTKKSDRLASIEAAMLFFSELARKAVLNAEYSEERVPPGVRQLVSI